MGRKRCPFCGYVIRTYAYYDGFHFGSHAPMKTGLCVGSGRSTKDAPQQNAHPTPKSLATSQAVVNASAESQSDGESQPAQARVA